VDDFGFTGAEIVMGALRTIVGEAGESASRGVFEPRWGGFSVRQSGHIHNKEVERLALALPKNAIML
jgi:hypothetical protein